MKKDNLYKKVTNVFNILTTYYNYPYVNLSVFDEESDTRKRALKTLNERNLSKLSFITKELDCDEEADILGVESIYNNTKGYVDIISLSYRFLEELGFEELIIKISNYNNSNELIEYLDYMDIDYEIDDSLNSKYFNFNIVSDETYETYIFGGEEDSKVGFIGIINNIIEDLEDEFERDTYFGNINTCDVYIEAKNHEEELMAFSLMQDLRLSELLVELDLGNSPEYKSRMTILLNKDDLQKGLIKVKDNATNEEQLVDENEIIDYIVSNL